MQLRSCPKNRSPDELDGGAGDFSIYMVDDAGKLNVSYCGLSATLSHDLTELEFDE